MTAQLTHGDVVGGFVAGSNKICYRFGLREVHLSIKKGPFGEFAWFGHATAVLDELFQHLI